MNKKTLKQEIAILESELKNDFCYLSDDPGGNGKRNYDKKELKLKDLQIQLLRLENESLKKKLET